MPLSKSIIIYLCIILITILVIPDVYAAKLLFIDQPGNISADEARAKTAADFYGMEFIKLELPDRGIHKKIVEVLRGSRKAVVFINARSLSRLSKDEVVKGLIERKKTGNDTTLVISGIDPTINRADLIAWSSGAIGSCSLVKNQTNQAYVEFADIPDINFMLSRQKTPASIDRIVYLGIGDAAKQKAVISIRTGESTPGLPVVVKTSLAGFDVFYLSDVSFQHQGNSSNECATDILQMLPVLVPVKYGCREYCWQSPGVYANLTIDDPFLVEPYGYLSFAGLLREMEKVRFHATIAFIPWNYERSENNVAEIVRNNPDKYSIAVHGSDHGLREFEDNGKKNLYEEKIRKALARMESFRELTGIDYERVMVFPRNIGSSDALQVLKRYNFLGTANWNNIREGETDNSTTVSCLNSVIHDVNGFPALMRHATNAESFRLASIMYLGMPVLFSAHHNNFEMGIDGFNKTADLVSSLWPQVEWVSLGNVFRRLYLKKKRDDGHWEIKTYSRRILINNKNKSEVIYQVTKSDGLDIPIENVKFEGVPIDFTVAGGEIQFDITVPPSSSREALIEYKHNENLGDVDISKNSYEVRLVRWLSEFRDMRMSQNEAGRLVVKLVYSSQETKEYLLLMMGIFFGLIGVCIYIKRKSGKPN